MKWRVRLVLTTDEAAEERTELVMAFTSTRYIIGRLLPAYVEIGRRMVARRLGNAPAGSGR